MNILPVDCCFFAPVNCKFRATVQATEAHRTFFFYPDGFAAADFNCINGADFFAEPATRAVFVYGKCFGAAHILIAFI